MAYDIIGISAVEAWTAASEYADDGALDATITACMTNGTTGTSCDELKEGTINLKVHIGYAPASIISMDVRIYLQEAMTTGDQALVPYTDSNSVSSSNAVIVDYSSIGWKEHVTDGAFLAELGDLGGSCAVRLAATGGAKSKISEVNIDITIYTLTLAGITRDVAGDALVSCEYNIYGRSGMAPETWNLVESGTSNGSTGAYTEELGIGTYRVVAVKDVEPQIADMGPPIIGSTVTASDDIFALGLHHSLSNDDQVYIYQCGSAALPTGVSEDTLYYIVNQSSDTCKLSTSQGGGAVNITVDGDCWIVGEPAATS